MGEKNAGSHRKVYFEANLGITPMNNGEVIMLFHTSCLQKREVVIEIKQCKALGEDARLL